MQGKATEGIRVRHSRSCPSTEGGSCTVGRSCGCTPGYEARVWNPRTKGWVRKSFPTKAAAKAWQVDQLSAKQRGKLVTTTRKTLEEAWEEWYHGATAERPTVLRRGGGGPYKPSVIRQYRWAMNTYVLPDLGGYRLSELRKTHLLDLRDRLTGEGLSASTIRNAVMPIRAVYRRERERNESLVNPTHELELSNDLGSRDRVAGIDEVELLIGLVPAADRAIWATAFYAGLRRGEMQALKWSDVDLDLGFIKVQRSWDPVAGYVEPKSKKGNRKVPVIGMPRPLASPPRESSHLHRYLTELKKSTGRGGDDLVFGSTRRNPFTPSNIRRKALAAWGRENEQRAEMGVDPVTPIGLHELRHSCVTFMSEAGFSLEAIGDLVGHSSTYMSDQYRHLRADHLDTYGAKLDDYALLSSTSVRIGQLEEAAA